MVRFPLPLPIELDAGDGLRLTISHGDIDEDRFGHLSDDEVHPLFVDIREVGDCVGRGTFHVYGADWGSFEDIWISPPRRRLGFATRTYDAIESVGLRVVRSDALDVDGELFWLARDARRNAGSMTP